MSKDHHTEEHSQSKWVYKQCVDFNATVAVDQIHFSLFFIEAPLATVLAWAF
jgi:hypothetical protein